MGLFRRERRSVSFQDVWGSGGDWSSDVVYSAGEALKLSAVKACVRLRANLISQMPVCAYREDRDGYSVPVAVQPELISGPSPTVSRSGWFAQMSVSRDLWGNAFGAVLARDAAGYPTQVEWLRPDSVRASRESYAGRLAFTLDGQPFPAENMLLVPGMLLPGSPFGVAPLEGTGLVELARRAQEFGSDWFKNGAVPSMVVTAAQELTAEQAEAIKSRLMSSWRNRSPGVVGAGLSVDAFDVKGDETQFLETIQAVQIQICQVFGVPPEEIGVSASGSSVTYANREQRTQAMLTNGLNADLVTIQEVLTGAVPRPQFVRFTTEALLRSDLKTRYEAHKLGIDGGWLSVEDVRRIEDLPPSPVEEK